MRYGLDDTIAAVSTPVGEGGIGIVRLSGSESLSILRTLFVPHGPQASSGAVFVPTPYHLHYGHIADPRTGERVDEVLVAYMPAPHTYTREDVAEIDCHGGIVPLRRLLALCLRLGSRTAHEGEFTLRAFLNGRLDLAQAEAVLDLVRAKTEASLRVAMGQLGGELSREVRSLRSDLMETLAYLQASLDFPEDEIPSHNPTACLSSAIERLGCLLAQAERGMIYRQGLLTAIVGRPNVGKSSLLNALLRTSRAIVTPIPGTTRDTLEETINLHGIPICLIDTAGMREGGDTIERLGVERSRQALERADLVLAVIDESQPLCPEDLEIAALVAEKPAILVLNKTDLPESCDISAFLPNVRRVRISALTGEGLPVLEEMIADLILGGHVVTSDLPLVSSPRHQEVLSRALEHLRDAMRAHESSLPADFVAIDMTAAVGALGEITGETASEDLLETVFSSFCIGK